MELRDGYKHSEVGIIPEDWVIEEFGNIVDYVKGFPFKSSEYSDSGVRIIRVSDTTFDSIEDSSPVFVIAENRRKYLKWELREYDLIFSTVGSKPPMYDSLVGKAILVSKRYVGSLLNQNAVLIRSKKLSKQNQIFLLSNFRTPRYINYIEIIYRGNANQASITLNDLFKFKIPRPSSEVEQTAIANALSDADTLIGSLQKLITKKRQIKQGAMQTLLNPYENGWVKAGWIKKKLGEVADIRSGGTPSTRVDEFWNGNVLWCTPTDITALNGSKYISDTSRKISIKGLKNSSAEIIPENSIVMTSRATIGECAINLLPISTNQGFKNFIPFEFTDCNFLYYSLQTMKQTFIGLCSGSTFLEISKNQVFNVEICLPKEKLEQNRIAMIISDMDIEIATLETKLTKYQKIKQGMMQNLLTGRIRLV